MAWDSESHQPDLPFKYSSTLLPVFDRNLKALAQKVRTTCMLAHVRGVAYDTAVSISQQNTHPFCYDGFKVALAHNGELHQIDQMKKDLLEYISPEVARLISGSTDSEWIYAVLLSQLDDPMGRSNGGELRHAVEKTLRIIRQVRERCGIKLSSSVNLFITNGREIVGVRFCYDFGCYATADPSRLHEANLAFLSLWFTTGREYGFHEGEWQMIGGSQTASSLIIASEPLTSDTSRWLEVPEYSMFYADTLGERPTMEVFELDV
jgi:glutamine amidotransferase